MGHMFGRSHVKTAKVVVARLACVSYMRVLGRNASFVRTHFEDKTSVSLPALHFPDTIGIETKQ